MLQAVFEARLGAYHLHTHYLCPETAYDTHQNSHLHIITKTVETLRELSEGYVGMPNQEAREIKIELNAVT